MLAAYQPLLAEAQRLLDVSGLIPRLEDFAMDPAGYEAAHRALLEMLDRLGEGGPRGVSVRPRGRQRVVRPSPA